VRHDDLEASGRRDDAVQLGQGFIVASGLIEITRFRQQIFGTGVRIVCSDRILSHQARHIIAIQDVSHTQ